eukprot:Gb_32639 [translate_table: standard]
MARSVRVVGVTQVDSRMPMEAWDELMPLPGDIVVGICDQGSPYHFITSSFPGGKAGVNNELRRLHRETHTHQVSIRVMRGQSIIDLDASIVPEKSGMLTNNKFRLGACSDDRHVVMVEDCTEERCIRLQGAFKLWTGQVIRKNLIFINRTIEVQNGFHLIVRFAEQCETKFYHDVTRRILKARCNNQALTYNWKEKMKKYIPNEGSPVIFSLLFIPRDNSTEYYPVIEDTTARVMAWLYAAQSSGAPLIFVNIQTEQISNSCSDHMLESFGHYSLAVKQGSMENNAEAKNHIAKGVRLWYLPGMAEITAILKLNIGETRFGIDISRTDEGFCYISSICKHSAAGRAGLKVMFKRANQMDKLLVLSRVAGKNVTPRNICCTRGSILCDYDTKDIKELLSLAAKSMEDVTIHLMAWDIDVGVGVHQSGEETIMSSPGNFYTPLSSPMPDKNPPQQN